MFGNVWDIFGIIQHMGGKLTSCLSLTCRMLDGMCLIYVSWCWQFTIKPCSLFGAVVASLYLKAGVHTRTLSWYVTVGWGRWFQIQFWNSPQHIQNDGLCLESMNCRVLRKHQMIKCSCMIPTGQGSLKKKLMCTMPTWTSWGFASASFTNAFFAFVCICLLALKRHFHPLQTCPHNVAIPFQRPAPFASPSNHRFPRLL